MSNYLGIAAASAALVSLVRAATSPAALGPPPMVVTGRPEATAPPDDGSRVSLCLVQVTPSAAWSNCDVPTRRPDGVATRRPAAAFDLHYLISFAGDESKQVPERLLGAVLAALHAEPVLSRDRIRRLVPPGAESVEQLAGADLADQVETIRLTPVAMTVDELAKLWPVFFQVPYRLSVVYQASVVLLETELPTQPVLPVRSRQVAVETLRRPAPAEAVAEAMAGAAGEAAGALS